MALNSLALHLTSTVFEEQALCNLDMPPRYICIMPKNIWSNKVVKVKYITVFGVSKIKKNKNRK